MSQTRSPSTQQVYGLARVCRVWEPCGDRQRQDRGLGQHAPVRDHSRAPACARGQHAMANQQVCFRPRRHRRQAVPFDRSRIIPYFGAIHFPSQSRRRMVHHPSQAVSGQILVEHVKHLVKPPLLLLEFRNIVKGLVRDVVIKRLPPQIVMFSQEITETPRR
jgi:hypothetical protein